MSKEEGKMEDVDISESPSEKNVIDDTELEEEATETEKFINSEIDLADHDDEEEEEEEDDDEEEEEEEEEEDDMEDLNFLDAVIIEDVIEAFQLFDVEDEDIINPKKLFGALRTLGYNPTEAEVQDLIESVDRDGNGEISLDEFMVMMRKRWNENLIEENAREAFCVFDSDENDIITTDDIAPIFTRLGHNLTQKQLQQIITAADIDGDGAVTFEDFLTVFHKRPRDSLRASRVSTAQDVSKLSTGRDVLRMSISQDVGKMSTGRDVLRMSISQDVGKMSTGRNVSRVSISQDVSKLSTGRDVSRVSISQDVAKMSTGRNVSRVSISQDVSKVSTALDK